MGDRRSVRRRNRVWHTNLIVGVEVGLVVVVSDLSVPGPPVWERDSAKVTEKDSWVPAWVSGLQFGAAPWSS